MKFKQIFINLINNAIKFTQKGEIKFGYRLDETNQLIFYVSDTGIGISPDKQDRIFDRFIQIENGPNRTYGGTGLGLSIVKGLVILLGGKIWLESELKKGTTFYFTIDGTHLITQQTEEIATENITTVQFTNKTILLVEDDTINALYFKEILDGLNLEIIHTTLGEEAIAISLEKELDLVLMDVHLPDISGYDATHEIKSHNPTIKIIAQTAYAEAGEKQKALDAGCVDYISKPFTLDKLIKILNKHLG